jgi:hypothetical protein
MRPIHLGKTDSPPQIPSNPSKTFTARVQFLFKLGTILLEYDDQEADGAGVSRVE